MNVWLLYAYSQMWFSLYAKERHWFKCPIFSNLSVRDENGVWNNLYLKATVVPAAFLHLLCCPVIRDEKIRIIQLRITFLSCSILHLVFFLSKTTLSACCRFSACSYFMVSHELVAIFTQVWSIYAQISCIPLEISWRSLVDHFLSNTTYIARTLGEHGFPDTKTH